MSPSADQAADSPTGESFPDRAGEGAPPSPRATVHAAFGEAIPSLLHDLRGSAMALVALSHVVAEGISGRTPRDLAEVAAGLEVNAEILASQLDALSFLARPALRTQVEAAVWLRTIPGRLPKVLSRAALALNLEGESPDTPVEGRAATVLTDGVLRILAHEHRRAAPASIGLAADGGRDGVLVVKLTLRRPAAAVAAEHPALETTLGSPSLADAIRGAARRPDFQGVALRRAFDVLGGSVEAVTGSAPGEEGVILRLDVPAGRSCDPAVPGGLR